MVLISSNLVDRILRCKQKQGKEVIERGVEFDAVHLTQTFPLEYFCDKFTSLLIGSYSDSHEYTILYQLASIKSKVHIMVCELTYVC